MKCWFITRHETCYRKEKKISININKCRWLAFIIFVFLVHTKIQMEFCTKSLYEMSAPVLWGSKETRGSRWDSHMASSPSLLSSKCFCHHFHSPNQKAWQGKGTWEARRVYRFKITRIQSASVMEGVWLCCQSTGWNSSHKGNCV